MAGTWLDDESGKVKAEAGSPEFVIEGEVKGSPVNALFDQALIPGQYFEIDVVELNKSVFIGVTTRAGFGKGYKCKGLFFGRNLSNGGALVREGFGEEITAGQKIGVLTEFDSSSCTVTFFQDGRCLGPGFVANRSSDGDIFPVVHTMGEGDKFGIRFPEAPAQRAREGKGGAAAHPAEGSWVLKEFLTGPELHSLPFAEKMGGDRPITMNVKATEPGAFRLEVHVCNRLGMELKSEPDESLAPFEKATPGAIMSTRMMGPPGAMEVENTVQVGLGGLHKWLARPDSLMLTGPTVEMSFVPHTEGGRGLPATEVDLK